MNQESKNNTYEKEKFETLLTEKQIQERVAELGASISNDYRDNDGRDLVLIGILNGASFFHTDLLRNIDFDPSRLKSDFMRISSYVLNQTSSGEPRILADTKLPINGKDVVIVEDIVDTGFSLKTLLNILWARNPKSIEICALLSKTEKRIVEGIPIKYLGFEIPDKYVVGYGLDDGYEKYRSLKDIAYILG